MTQILTDKKRLSLAETAEYAEKIEESKKQPALNEAGANHAMIRLFVNFLRACVFHVFYKKIYKCDTLLAFESSGRGFSYRGGLAEFARNILKILFNSVNSV